jgi:hypothetical protein
LNHAESQLDAWITKRGWTPLFANDCGPGGGHLHDGMLQLAVPIEVRNPGQVPLLVPGALRFPLLTRLLSHPDAAAVDALLNGLVI